MRFETRTCDLCATRSESARRNPSDGHDRQRWSVVFGGWILIEREGRMLDVCPVCAWDLGDSETALTEERAS